MKIKIHVGNHVIPATWSDDETAQDFGELLPLTLSLEDVAGTVKIWVLSRSLKTGKARGGRDLVILGDLGRDKSPLNVPGNLTATIEPADSIQANWQEAIGYRCHDTDGFRRGHSKRCRGVNQRACR